MASIVGTNIPDYRGYFLRHVGGNSAALGAVQNDAIRNIKGVFFPGNNFGYAGCLYAYWAVRAGDWDNSENSLATNDFSNMKKFSTPNSYVKTGEFVFDASLYVPVASENRPINKGVKYLIRALN